MSSRAFIGGTSRSEHALPLQSCIYKHGVCARTNDEGAQGPRGTRETVVLIPIAAYTHPSYNTAPYRRLTARQCPSKLVPPP
jgi:hypothetical protein